MREGFSIVQRPATAIMSCRGCKYLKRVMAKSGNNPLYNYNCTHTDAHKPVFYFMNNIASMTDEEPTPPHFCPFLPENKKS